MSAIVVGYVPKPEGVAAIGRAIDEARLRGLKVVVVNSQLSRASSETAEADLDRIGEQFRAAGVEHEVRHFVHGADAADQIIATVEEFDAELIIIGLRRRTPVGKLILGSNAQRILLDAPCPVLAVKAE